MKKVLITGINSFTGKHLEKYLKEKNFEVVGTTSKTCDITNKEDIVNVLNKFKPNFIIHLAGISFAAHKNNEDFYKINTIGTTNLLDAILQTNLKVENIILSSSATIYGNQCKEVLDESLCPKPANHYGASKYSMECLASGYFNKLPIIITRPFNYTGIGQAQHFLIPKIVSHFKENKKEIELGNLDVKREFNDVNFVCEVYSKLLITKEKSQIVNIASQNPIALLDVIKLMNKISGYEIKVLVNPAFVRKDEIKTLCGSSKKLFELIGEIKIDKIENTLKGLYEA
ncbi:NAD-dependent epimerase/dehydratase family protein [Poseidonibacter antarcticus]|uniref:NAD-dependent epimerase/dehydratase family protein n=1 Tax=Poseidonibacter antarcticus TaxID=2478538 RepID=UPI000EF553D5|nr:NAD-dependent epimerase/dehydratase family protein [Poseidonibacter antarcticus]